MITLWDENGNVTTVDHGIDAVELVRQGWTTQKPEGAKPLPVVEPPKPEAPLEPIPDAELEAITGGVVEEPEVPAGETTPAPAPEETETEEPVPPVKPKRTRRKKKD